MSKTGTKESALRAKREEPTTNVAEVEKAVVQDLSAMLTPESKATAKKVTAKPAKKAKVAPAKKQTNGHAKSKLGIATEMLLSKRGATAEELKAATGWSVYVKRIAERLGKKVREEDGRIHLV